LWARRTTKRGDVLVFGGDEVYPVASREAYERKLVAPPESLQAALRRLSRTDDFQVLKALRPSTA